MSITAGKSYLKMVGTHVSGRQFYTIFTAVVKNKFGRRNSKNGANFREPL